MTPFVEKNTEVTIVLLEEIIDVSSGSLICLILYHKNAYRLQLSKTIPSEAKLILGRSLLYSKKKFPVASKEKKGLYKKEKKL